MADFFDHPTLVALVDTVIPAADFPSGRAAGVGHFVRGSFGRELRGRQGGLEAGLTQLNEEAGARHGRDFAALGAGEQTAFVSALLSRSANTGWADAPAFLNWVIRLCMQSYTGDPGYGGNRDGVAWRRLDDRPLSEGTHWPNVPVESPPVTAWDDVQEQYDALVVGAGLGTQQPAPRRRLAACHERRREPGADHPGAGVPGEPARGGAAHGDQRRQTRPALNSDPPPRQVAYAGHPTGQHKA